MLATAIGDALGWPNEQRSKNTTKNSKVNDSFIEWTRRCNGSYWHYEKILPGEYSDDTQLTLSIARSIIAGNWEDVFVKKELPFWLEYERGGGRAVLKAANACKKGVLLWKSNYSRDYFNAGGNGAVMRILPHVIATAHKNDINTLMIEVIKDTLITHGHPRAILGATCYAYALDYLLRKDSILEYGELLSALIDGQHIWGALPNEDIFGVWLHIANQHKDFEYAHQWKNDRARMIDQLEYIKSALKKGLMFDDNRVLTQLECFTKVNGAGDVAILSAVYLASKYANNPVLGIKIPAFSFGADTDTIASITGGLLGILCGTNWIPVEWKTVQDYDCLIQVTELLLSENSKEAAKALTIKTKEQNGSWELSSIGLMRSLSQVTLPSGKDFIVAVTKYLSALGQTIYIKRYQKREYIQQLDQQVQLELQPTATVVKSQGVKQGTVQNSMTSHPQRVIQKELPVQFLLNSSVIASLIDEPLLNRITFRKVLQIANAIATTDKTSASTARHTGVKEAIVELIKIYIR